MITEEADLQRPLVQERRGETLNALPDHSTRDGPRIDLVRLPRLTFATPRLAHHLRRDTNNALTRSDQRLLKTPGEMPAILDRPHPLPIELPRPTQRSTMPGLITPDLQLAS